MTQYEAEVICTLAEIQSLIIEGEGEPVFFNFVPEERADVLRILRAKGYVAQHVGYMSRLFGEHEYKIWWPK